MAAPTPSIIVPAGAETITGVVTVSTTNPPGLVTVLFTASINLVSVQSPNVAVGTLIQFIGAAPSPPFPTDPSASPVPNVAELTGTYVAQVAPTPTPSSTTGPLLPNAGGQSPTNTNGGNSQSTPTVRVAQPSSGISTGAIAGAAAGCLVAGLLLGFAIAFFFLRRKKQAQQNGPIVSELQGEPNFPDESKAYFAAPSPPAETKFQLDKFLLDSSPDKEIASELRSLGTLIQQHVENNYHLRPVQEDPRVLAVSLVQLGVVNGGSLAPDALAQLALDPNTRQVALQHVISQVLFTSVDVGSRSALSMLPAPLAAFLRSMPPKETGDKTEATSFALNQWRALSAFLLHPARSQRTPLPTSSAAVTPQAAALSNALDTFLGYFVATDEGSRSQQRSHLQAVITETTKLGYVLLSQPSEWRFVHALSQNTGGRVAVVCAGLVKITEKDGTPYPVPKQVVPPQTVLI